MSIHIGIAANLELRERAGGVMRRFLLSSVTAPMLVLERKPAINPMTEADVASPGVPRRRPISGNWALLRRLSGADQWLNADEEIGVLSSVESVKGHGDGPQWHVSVSKIGIDGPAVASDEAIAIVRRDFDMARAEEDNHVAHGKVRNLWLPVDPLMQGVDCECKATEIAHREGAYDARVIMDAVGLALFVPTIVALGLWCFIAWRRST